MATSSSGTELFLLSSNGVLVTYDVSSGEKKKSFSFLENVSILWNSRYTLSISYYILSFLIFGLAAKKSVLFKYEFAKFLIRNRIIIAQKFFVSAEAEISIIEIPS